MADCVELIRVVSAVRKRLAQDDSDFTWTRWKTQAEALEEIDEFLAQLRVGQLPHFLGGVFAPTASVQEHSLSNGWADEFLALSVRFDRALLAD